MPKKVQSYIVDEVLTVSIYFFIYFYFLKLGRHSNVVNVVNVIPARAQIALHLRRRHARAPRHRTYGYRCVRGWSPPRESAHWTKPQTRMVDGCRCVCVGGGGELRGKL